MRIAVVTAALPTRAQQLAEACYTVAAQTVQPVHHLIGVDYAREGSAATRNRLVFASDADWVAFLDDDDLLYRNHLEVLAGLADACADIAYTGCDVSGREGWNPYRPFDADALRAGNYIPATVLIRRSLFVSLGGFRPSTEVAHGWEDWDLWLRALSVGAVFRSSEEKTWQYRFHEGCKTYRGEEECY